MAVPALLERGTTPTMPFPKITSKYSFSYFQKGHPFPSHYIDP
jgi:hypothetical protein